MNPILCEVRRGGRVESVHRGAVAVVEGRKTILARGDVKAPVFLRSCAKPFQCFTVVACGAADAFGFDDYELALISGSHGGAPEHVRAATSILRKAGLKPALLRCGAHAPYAPRALEALHRSGKRPTALHNNCSGKHSGMLAAARYLGAPLESYLDPSHPVQRANLMNLSRFAEVPERRITVAVDGCSAPTFVLDAVSLARATASLCIAGGAARIRDTMMRHPDAVGRLSSEVMSAAPGKIVAKTGAEGAYIAGLPGRGIGIALKFEDGSHRAVFHLLAAVVRKLGLLKGRDLKALEKLADPVIRNHAGLSVGEMRCIL